MGLEHHTLRFEEILTASQKAEQPPLRAREIWEWMSADQAYGSRARTGNGTSSLGRHCKLISTTIPRVLGNTYLGLLSSISSSDLLCHMSISRREDLREHIRVHALAVDNLLGPKENEHQNCDDIAV